jgi:hypothetical protein
MAKVRTEREPVLGFSLRLEVVPGLSLAQLRRIGRRLEDHAEANELVLEGDHYLYFVRGATRGLTCTDQVDLANLLFDVPGVQCAVLGPLVEEPEDEREAAFVRVGALDMATIAATMLYRLGRVSAELYLQILGGFVRRAMH